MDNVKFVVIFTAATFVAIYILQRRILFRLSCASVFFNSYMIFVCVGVLIAPWLLSNEYVKFSYSGLSIDLLTSGDFTRAIRIALFGLLSYLLGHRYVDWSFPSGSYPVGLLAFSDVKETDRRDSKLRLLLIGTAAVSFAVLLSKADAVSAGTVAFFANDVSTWYAARASMGELGRLYFSFLLSLLMFASIALWISFKRRPTESKRWWGYIGAGLTLWFLFVTFQKRPLIVFLGCLFLAGVVARYMRGGNSKDRSTYPSRRGVFLVIGGFVVLLFAYYKLTVPEAPIGWAAMLSLDRIFGRLSLMCLMYAHYFPDIEPHYGLSNIGLLANAVGTTPYQDTVEVLKYFDPSWMDEGSGAINALYDSYGAFGWPGVVLSGFTLGVVINLLDRWMTRLPSCALNRALYICMLLFSYYLSQASVARSLLTYGAVVFIAAWAIIRFRLVDGSSHSADSAPSPKA